MMDTPSRESICQEIYALTGERLSSDDPIVLAGLLFSHKLQEAGSNAACEIKRATEGSLLAIQSAKVLVERVEQVQFRVLEAITLDKSQAREDHARLIAALAADRDRSGEEFAAERDRLRTEFAAERTRFSYELRNAIDGYIKVASRPVSDSAYRLVPAWFILTAFFSGVLVFALAACLITGSTSWARDASIGRDFKRMIPMLDSATRDKLIKAAQNATPK
jgi:hypothetical protein